MSARMSGFLAKLPDFLEKNQLLSNNGRLFKAKFWLMLKKTFWQKSIKLKFKFEIFCKKVILSF